jgi:hypothetical protein
MFMGFSKRAMSRNATHVSYRVQAHREVPRAQARTFLHTCVDVLGDDAVDGWAAHGYVFTHVKRGAAHRGPVFSLRLTPVHVMHALFPMFAKDNLSVADMDAGVVHFNLGRWDGSIPNASGQPLERYRRYLVNHEMGHLLGRPHPTAAELRAYGKQCGSKTHAAPAPIMMQQTRGLAGLSPNTAVMRFDNAL